MSDASRSSRPEMTRRHWLGHLASTALGVPAIQFFSSLEAKRRAAPQEPTGAASCSGWGRPQPPRHLGPEARQREERRPVQADRHLGPGRADQRAPAQGRQADASPEHHPLARFQGRQPRPRHVHDAHRIRAQPDGRASRASARSAPSSWASGSRTSTCRTASRSTSPGMGAGFLGMSYSPVRRPEPERPDRQSAAARRTSTTCGWSAGCRCSARSRTSSSRQRTSQAAVDHKAVYAKTLRMMNSQHQGHVQPRDASRPRCATPTAEGSFGSGCLMARRLVEQGVTYVEVSLGGWDTHTNNFDTLSKRLLPELDKGMAALVADLAQRRLLDSTTDRLDGRVRPHAADQSERRPRPLAAELVGRRWAAAA